MPSVSISHIDTCFPDYLTDHHNRDGELLLGVFVDGNTTVRKVMEQIEEEFYSSLETIPECITDDMFTKAVKEEFHLNRESDVFDNSLDEDYGDEMPQAWFLVTWEE